jgi:hypothetical protein
MELLLQGCLSGLLGSFVCGRPEVDERFPNKFPKSIRAARDHQTASDLFLLLRRSNQYKAQPTLKGDNYCGECCKNALNEQQDTGELFNSRRKSAGEPGSTAPPVLQSWERAHFAHRLSATKRTLRQSLALGHDRFGESMAHTSGWYTTRAISGNLAQRRRLAH